MARRQDVEAVLAAAIVALLRRFPDQDIAKAEGAVLQITLTEPVTRHMPNKQTSIPSSWISLRPEDVQTFLKGLPETEGKSVWDLLNDED